MVEATNIQSWVNLIERTSSKDLAEHKITLLQKPMLQICGDPSTEVIGEWKLIDTAEKA
jgi:hypothetical protein